MWELLHVPKGPSMPASRYLRVASAISLVLAGAGQVAAVQAQPAAGEAAPAPVQLIELTTASGETTELAQAGLSEEEPGSGAGAEVPAGTVEGNGVAPARASLLAAATDAPDLERDAGLLTEPLEVDGFLVAGFTWSGSEALPTGTQIYLRVREGGVWSSWYLNEAADAGPDDAEGNGGTDEFVTGGADAVQAAVVSGGRALPTDLTLALVPAKPAGEEVLSDDDVTTTQAGPTAIAQDTAVTQEQLVDRLVDATAPVGSEDGTTADEGTDVSETTGATASAATSAGHGVNLDLPTALAATTTANGLPVPVVTRAEWGANQAYMTWSPKYANAAHVVVHHTAGTNNYTAAQSASIVAGIYYYHAVTLDWGDIGYNFLVDKYGQVFEGRYGTLSSAAGKMVIGGHARGVNTGTMGISMMGNYVSTSPTDVQIDRVGKMAGWFLKRSGVTNASASASFTILTTEKYKAGQVVNLPRILAHRDVGYTTCPGDGGYSKMGQIRSVAQSQISSGSTGGGSSTPAAPTWRLVDKTWYLYGADGARLTGWQKVNGSWYYLSPVNGAMATGWQAISGKWYYLTESGAMATGWKKLGSHWYYFQTSGAMVTAWQDIAGLRYYFTANGDMASGWLDTGGTTYYLTASGAMHTGWFKDGDAWYYLTGSGAMARGWAKVASTWYYLDPSDGHMHSGWAKVGSHWYYLAPSGDMRTGWQQVSGTWYYLHGDGHMATGWLQLGSTWYYLDPTTGKMATGTITVNGGTYNLSPSGAWIGYTAPAGYLQPTDRITPLGWATNELTPGMNGVKVRIVQQRLGISNGSALATANGTFQNAVRNFQRRAGLPQTGVVDQQTWNAMGTGFSWWVDQYQATPIGLSATRSERIEAMIGYAWNQLGSSYTWGGAGTYGLGFDCSGLVLQSLYHGGMDPQPINVIKHAWPAYRTSRELYAYQGFMHVPFSQRQRGDIVFYRSRGTVVHVSIYLGNDQVIHTDYMGRPARIDNVTAGYSWGAIAPEVVRPFP